jgi:hypothetical protein
MVAYRCYFLDREDHIRAAEDIEAKLMSRAIGGP